MPNSPVQRPPLAPPADRKDPDPMSKLLSAMLAACAALALLAAPVAAGHDQNPSEKVDRYTYDVDPVPHPATDQNAEVDGTVRATALPNGQIQVKVRVSGLTPNAPHAQHLHGNLAGGNVCPGPELAGEDGLIATLDAAGAYGGIQVSLTTTGDTSLDSALAVSRFPVADKNGNLNYNRTIDVPQDVYDNLGVLHYVVHGIDLNNSGGYDFEAGESPLDPSLPFEATIPSGCAGQDTTR